MATVELCGYNASTGLVAGVWLYTEGSGITPVTQGITTAYEDVTSLAVRPGPDWTRTGPLTYTAPAPAVAPDVNGFVTAVAGDGALAATTRLAAVNALASLVTAVSTGQTSLITAVWALMVATYSISSADQTAVAALAVTYGIPGISS